LVEDVAYTQQCQTKPGITRMINECMLLA